MKKKYISPCSYEIETELSSIMAGSLDPDKLGDQTVTPDGSGPAPDEFTSRRGNLWDDEEYF